MGNDDRLDARCVDELYRQHAAELLRFLRSILRNEQAAQDALQTTFVRLAECGAAVRPTAVRSWLFQVAYREAMRLYRRAAQARRLPLVAADTEATDGPLEEAARRERIERIRALIADLPAPQRLVVEQRIYENKTFAEIAREQGVPLGTVLTRMRLALSRLRDALQELGEL